MAYAVESEQPFNLLLCRQLSKQFIERRKLLGNVASKLYNVVCVFCICRKVTELHCNKDSRKDVVTTQKSE